MTKQGTDRRAPGPWRSVQYDPQFAPDVYEIVADDGFTVCEAGDDNGAIGVRGEANARLIAAAPALADALRAILDSHSEPIEGSDGYNVTCHGQECSIARAALKATGIT